MAFSKGSGSAVFVILLLSLFASLPYCVARDHIVGKDHGWQIPADAGPTVNLNYSTWAASRTFLLGDTITFRWQRGQHTVFQVNYSTYVNCSFSMYYGHDWIHNWTDRVARVVIPLNETKTYYFACGVGNHCAQGMKVAIPVIQNVSAAAPGSTANISPTASQKTSSAAASSTFILVSALALVGSSLFMSVSQLLN